MSQKSGIKRKMEEDARKCENKKQKIEDHNTGALLANELMVHVMQSAGVDQVLVVALWAMVSSKTRTIALYVREKYGIPALAFYNVQIEADADVFYLTIPKHRMTPEELFLLRCGTNSVFYNYLEFRGWSLSYTIAGWIYHKYSAFATQRKRRSVQYHKLTTEVLSGGIHEDDPSPSTVEKTYYWCVLREQELKQRGWTWEAKKWNGFASCHIDPKQPEVMVATRAQRGKENKIPLFVVDLTYDAPEHELDDENELDDASDEEPDSQDENSEEDFVED